MIVRAYFVLGGEPGSVGLVPVLRDVPKTDAVATAAMNALLDGPRPGVAGERTITTAIPDGTRLLGLTIKSGVATVDLSTEFDSGGGTASMQYRLAQVVYTLTQFGTVKSVVFQIEGETVTVFGSEGITLDGPVGRADYDDQLPSIFVDRPAYGAALGNPGDVAGNANVFEATFRIAILDAAGKTIVDQQVMATCGTGCRGTFDVTLPYTVSKAQWGTLRVYNPSAKDGTPEDIRDYPVWLTPGELTRPGHGTAPACGGRSVAGAGATVSTLIRRRALEDGAADGSRRRAGRRRDEPLAAFALAVRVAGLGVAAVVVQREAVDRDLHLAVRAGERGERAGHAGCRR